MSDSDDSDDENSDSEHAAPGAAVPPTPGAGHNARDLDRLEEDKTIWLEKQLETHFGPKLLRYRAKKSNASSDSPDRILLRSTSSRRRLARIYPRRCEVRRLSHS